MKNFCMLFAFLLCCTPMLGQYTHAESFDVPSNLPNNYRHSYRITPEEKKNLLIASGRKRKEFDCSEYLIRTTEGYDCYLDGRLEDHCYLDFNKDSVYSYYVYPEGSRSFYIKDGLVREVRFEAGGTYRYFYKNNHLHNVCSYYNGYLDNYSRTNYYWEGDRLNSIVRNVGTKSDTIMIEYLDSSEDVECAHDYMLLFKTDLFFEEDVPFLVCGYWGILPKYKKCILNFLYMKYHTSIECTQPRTPDRRGYIIQDWWENKRPNMYMASDSINVEMLKSIFHGKGYIAE